MNWYFMEHLRAIGIKIIWVGIITFSIYGIFHHASIGNMFLMTLLIVGITYIGDVFILPKINQAVAGVGDFVGYFILYWVFGTLFIVGTFANIIAAFAAAYLSVFAEIIFHIYVMDRVHEPDRGAPLPSRFQMEVAEETDIDLEAESEREEQREK